MKPFYVRQQEEERVREAKEREAQRKRDAHLEYGLYNDNNGNLTHDKWEQKQRRAPDPTPWLNGTAEERVREAKEREEHSKRDAALERALEDSASPSAHTQRMRKPMKPLRSSTYMVCTQAALNTKQARECVYSIE